MSRRIRPDWDLIDYVILFVVLLAALIGGCMILVLVTNPGVYR